MSNLSGINDSYYFLDNDDICLIENVMNFKGLPFRDLVVLAKLDPLEDFRFSNLAGIRLCGADLRGFDFTGADLTGTQFHRAIVDETTILDGAIFGEEEGEGGARLVSAAPQVGGGRGDNPFFQARHALRNGDVVLAREQFDVLPLVSKNYLGCGGSFDLFCRVVLIEDRLLNDKISKKDIDSLISMLLDMAVSVMGGGVAGNATLPVEKAVYFSRLFEKKSFLLEAWAYLSVVSNIYTENVCSQIILLLSQGNISLNQAALDRISYVRDWFRGNRVAVTIMDVICGNSSVDELNKIGVFSSM